MPDQIKGYTRIPNRIIRGNHGAINFAVLCAVASYGKACWASASTLAKTIGCCEASVRRSFRYWNVYCKEHGWPVWMQDGQRGKTYLIKIKFPGVFRSPTSDGESAEIGTLVNTPRTPVPTNNNQEKESNKKCSDVRFKPKKKRPYIEGDQAYKNDRGDWMVIIHDGTHKQWNGPASAVEWR